MTTPRDRLVRNARIATGVLVLSAVGATGVLTVVADASTATQHSDPGAPSSFWGTGATTNGTTSGIGPGGNGTTGTASHAS
jgi:hypothetical protein